MSPKFSFSLPVGSPLLSTALDEAHSEFLQRMLFFESSKTMISHLCNFAVQGTTRMLSAHQSHHGLARVKTSLQTQRLVPNSNRKILFE